MENFRVSVNASEWEFLENMVLAASSVTKSKQVRQQAGSQEDFVESILWKR